MSKEERGYGKGFALIVVLFILLIIVGASGYNNDGGYGYGGYSNGFWA
ncbi:YjcZ family sporulation protein [Ornithinibacillus scapharcae]|nr:YjcZ family sporulation protein [Ornithinibacillus scapharcae]